ncbi:disulfide bond formation protein DsbA [Rhodoferax koreense]|uniref:2-hydroxychromene-2-carboxylate isomerase n=1 Tax=Rhodoferax koreensis TaxID=1842727 RepID=A0A1P8K1H5_9BURK|nr:2-hydroxychromene-2-carboxylate isomerase [Rhodoferax koreense]APW39863.1 disulfide bond formation protein DsbA [Rhodoferax koreense]
MKEIVFHLDFISPYAYLAFERLPQELAGLSYRVVHRPVLLAGLLQHHGNKGPAEIPAKRDWLYRQVLWLAQQHGVPMQLPAQHPFNPLALLRLALACDAQGEPNRHVCATVFRHVWQGGADAADAARLAALRAELQPSRDPDSAEVKQQLRGATEAAAQAGIFGVPSFLVDGKLFWGLDALPMLRAYLAGDAWFDGSQWASVAEVPVGVVRQR